MRRFELRRLHTAVTPVLSSQQMEHFDSMQSSQLEMIEMQLKMLRAQATAEARGELPPGPQGVPGGFVAAP